ncbi:MAG: hypothetical protein K2H85_10760 [Allobaculum sp.]|nr:hypothetical protein [Allobaculum sp.]
MSTIDASLAIKLKTYISSIPDFEYVEPRRCPYYAHIGALLTDIILQAGLNYNSIVFPRVQSLLKRFPDVISLEKFITIIETCGLEDVLNWKNKEKLDRMDSMIQFLLSKKIDTVNDLIVFISQDDNIKQFKTIKGIGNKTCDYLLRLLGFDVVAVDRHIRSFVKEASIESDDYHDIQLLVSYTADMMKISRRCLDYSIWHYKNRTHSDAR